MPRKAAGLHTWRDRQVVSAAALALSAGFAAYAVTAVLGDVSAAFGEDPNGDFAVDVGMATTRLGIGLALIRLASLASLPAAGLADRLGRRRVLVGCAAVGLAVTGVGGLAPGWWWFVAIIAVARPLLTATNAVAVVVAAEETGSADRAKAIALIGGAYAVGSGAVSIVRGLLDGLVGFRGILALALVLLAVLPLAARHVEETPRFAGGAGERRRLGAVPRRHVRNLALVCTLTAGAGLVLGPAWTYVFVYGERVLGASPMHMALLVASAAPVGLLGLLLGRFGADRFGRRKTAGFAMVALSLAGAAAYSGAFAVFAAGYLATIMAGAAYTPSGGALDTEIFPTSVRATAAGWLAAVGVLGSVTGLAAFGWLADSAAGFGPAAQILFLPVAALAALYVLLPETRGLELEESAPEG